MTRRHAITGIALALVLGLASASASRGDRWTTAQIDELRALWIGELQPLQPDPTNRVADDRRAADLGHRLFFDTRLSTNGRVSCAACHMPDSEFQDNAPLASGVGTTDRRTMPIAGTAYSPFLFWDGRKDSQWAQALGPLESAVEHGGTRAQYAHVIADHYRGEYEAIFGPLPDLDWIPTDAGPVDDPASRAGWLDMSPAQRDTVTGIYVNIGKAIAAYERLLHYGPSRFDHYVEATIRNGRAPENVLTADEVAGLRLFMGKGNCTRCHNGPLFTNQEFHSTGVPAISSRSADRGRLVGATKALTDEFNCRSRWSDSTSRACPELEFLAKDSPELEGAFKVPSLRNVADRPPYMHAGQMATLADVLAHYNRAPAAPAGRTELQPLNLDRRELHQLEAFLRTLSGGTAASAELLRVPNPVVESRQ